MPKTRVHELAKTLNVSSKDLIEKLKEFNIIVKNHMSNLKEEEINTILKYYDDQKGKNNNKDVNTKSDKEYINSNEDKNNNKNKNKKDNKKDTAMQKEEQKEDSEIGVIQIGAKVTVKELAEKLEKSSSEIVIKIMNLKIMATINQEIDFDI